MWPFPFPLLHTFYYPSTTAGGGCGARRSYYVRRVCRGDEAQALNTDDVRPLALHGPKLFTSTNPWHTTTRRGGIEVVAASNPVLLIYTHWCVLVDSMRGVSSPPGRGTVGARSVPPQFERFALHFSLDAVKTVSGVWYGHASWWYVLARSETPWYWTAQRPALAGWLSAMPGQSVIKTLIM